MGDDDRFDPRAVGEKRRSGHVPRPSQTRLGSGGRIRRISARQSCLPRSRSTASLDEALSDAGFVVLALPSHGVRSVLVAASVRVGSDVPVLSLSKGLEEHTSARVSEIVDECWPGHEVGV